MDCLIVDDHAIFREAVTLLVATAHPDVRWRQAGSLAAARDVVASEGEPELVLLDLQLPDAQELDTLHRMQPIAPRARLCVLSADDRQETVLAALDAGAAGFIPKRADGDTLRAALATVLRGGVFVPPPALLSAPEAALPQEALQLSARQRDVLRLLIDGRSNKSIAQQLELSPSTVRTHVENLFERLGVHNRTQAVVRAARLGLQL